MTDVEQFLSKDKNMVCTDVSLSEASEMSWDELYALPKETLWLLCIEVGYDSIAIEFKLVEKPNMVDYLFDVLKKGE